MKNAGTWIANDTGAFLASNRQTDSWYRDELANRNVRIFVNCLHLGTSVPSWWRMAWSWASLLNFPAYTRAGSGATMQNNKNVTATIPSRIGIESSSLRKI